MIPLFNLAIIEGKIIQSQQSDRTYRKHKPKQEIIDIDISELDRQVTKEHKDIHNLVASKMFDVKYEDVTDEQRRIAKTINFKHMYKAGL